MYHNKSAALAFKQAFEKVSEGEYFERQRLLQSKLNRSFPVRCYVNSHLLKTLKLVKGLSDKKELNVKEKFPLFLQNVASTGSADEVCDLISNFRTSSDSSGRWRTTKKRKLLKEDSLFKSLPNDFLRLISYSKPEAMDMYICIWLAMCVKPWGRDEEATFVLRIDDQRSNVTHRIQFEYDNCRYCISVVGTYPTRKKGTVSGSASLQKERLMEAISVLGSSVFQTDDVESTLELRDPTAHKIPMVEGFSAIIRGVEEGSDFEL